MLFPCLDGQLKRGERECVADGHRYGVFAFQVWINPLLTLLGKVASILRRRGHPRHSCFRENSEHYPVQASSRLATGSTAVAMDDLYT